MPVIKILPHAEYCPDGASIRRRARRVDLRSAAGQRHPHRARLRPGLRLHDLPRHRARGWPSLSEMEEDEEDMLDRAWGLEPDSRLSCQALLRQQDVTVEIPKYSINHAKEGK
jgi:2Fe-2S ferredoxin